LIRQSKLPIKINRKTPTLEPLPFTNYFQGFEKVQAVRSVFGEQTDEVLANLKVGFISLKFMYMGIRDEDGSISIGTNHIRHSDKRTLYLDIVHELFHIKQWQEDKKHFELEHQKFRADWALYYSSPIEVPAYKHTVREAERIGMPREDIIEYLKMGPVPANIFAKFLKAMELGEGGGPKSAHQARIPVRINRKVSIPVFPFTDYFKGFEKIAAVKALLGERTDQFLDQLKLEFINGSFVQIISGDEDSDILVNVPYLKSSDLTSIFLDTLVCLNMVKRASDGDKALNSDQRVYGETPVLLESYKFMLQEARRLGVPDVKVLEHMAMPRFLMSSSDYEKFLQKLGLSKKKFSKR
jgi:hypothetical protein